MSLLAANAPGIASLGSAILPLASGVIGFVQNPVAAMRGVFHGGSSARPPIAQTLPTTGVARFADTAAAFDDARDLAADLLIELIDERLVPRAKAELEKLARAFITAFRPEIMTTIAAHRIVSGGIEAFRRDGLPCIRRIADIRGTGAAKATAFIAYIINELEWPPRLKSALIIHYLSTGPDETVTEYLPPVLRSLRGLPNHKAQHDIVQLIMRKYPHELTQFPSAVQAIGNELDPEERIAFLEKLYPGKGKPLASNLLEVDASLAASGWSAADRMDLAQHVVVNMSPLETVLPRYVALLHIKTSIALLAAMDIDADTQHEILMSLLDPDQFGFETLKEFNRALEEISEDVGLKTPQSRAERIRSEVGRIHSEKDKRTTARLSRDLIRNFASYARIENPTPEIAATYGRQYARIKHAMTALGIRVLDRFGSVPIADEIIHNRTHSDPSDTRPVAMMLMARHDHNDAFARYCRLNLPGLTQHYRVLYYEAESFESFISQFWFGISQRPSLIIVGGHGSPNRIWLGDESIIRRILGGANTFLTRRNIRHLSPAVSLVAGVTMLVVACSVAEGGETSTNIANTLADVLPETTIQAMLMPGDADVHIFGEDGQLVDANLTVPSYVINRSEGRYERVDGKLRYSRLFD